LTGIVIDRFFQQSLTDALRQAAMELPFDDRRVDQATEIVSRDENSDI
jgi:hypothetical protein